MSESSVLHVSEQRGEAGSSGQITACSSRGSMNSCMGTDDLLSLAELLTERVSTHLETVVMPKLFANQLEAVTTAVKESLKTEPTSRFLDGRTMSNLSATSLGALGSSSLGGVGSGTLQSRVSVGNNSATSSAPPSPSTSMLSSSLARPGFSDYRTRTPGAEGEAQFPFSDAHSMLGSKHSPERSISTVADLQSDIGGLLLADLRRASPPPTLGGACQKPILVPKRGSVSSISTPLSTASQHSMAPTERSSSKSSCVQHSLSSQYMVPVLSSSSASSIVVPVQQMASVPEWESENTQVAQLNQVPDLYSSQVADSHKPASFTDIKSPEGSVVEHDIHSLHIIGAMGRTITNFEGLIKWSLSYKYLWFPLKICGLVPWRAGPPNKFKDTLCLVYQWLFLMIALLGCVNAILPVAQRPTDDSMQPLCYSQSTCLRTGLLCDLPIAFGSLFGLLSVGAHRRSTPIVQCLQLIRSYAYRETFEERWLELTLWETPIAMLLWLFIVIERVRGTEVVQAVLDGSIDFWTALHIAMFALSSLLLVALAYLLLHITHGLASAVDAFSAGLILSGDIDVAVHRWNVVVAVLREVCGGIQSCLFVLQATVLFTFTLGAVDFYLSEEVQTNGSYASLLFPHVLLTLGISRVFFKAAGVTAKCTRVPSLVNMLDFGNRFDEKRQYVVQYVEQSAAGFYVADIRLTPSMTLKFSYVCILGLFTLATKLASGR